MKNKLLKAHFLNPQNMGTIENPTFQTIIKSDTCNDVVKIMISVDKSGTILDIKAQVFGCGYSISGTSIFTELAMGRNMNEVSALAQSTIDTLSPDIPEKHVTCISLARKAFEKIRDTAG